MRDRRRVSPVLAIFVVLFFASGLRAEHAAVPVTVALNKGTVITLKEPSKRVSVSNPEIADINLASPTEILLNGKKIGATTLIVWDAKGKPNFFDVKIVAEIEGLEQQIREIAPKDDIRVDMAHDTIVLSGKATNQQTIAKVVRLAEAYAVGSDITTKTKYSAGLTETETKSSGKVLNQIMVEEAQQVLLEVKVAQVDKSKTKEFGLSSIIEGTTAEAFTNLTGVAPSGERELVGKSKADGIAGNIPGLASIKPLDPFQLGVSHFPSGVGVVLKALAQKNLAKILAEPNLTVRSGEKGAFHVGTRFPIQTVQGVGAGASISVVFEEIGIRLNFAPEVLETGAVRLRIDPAEVSNITDFVRLQDLVAPIIDTRTVKTSVDLREGESLILAGLLSDQTKKNIQKIPLLGDIPIFGAIFRSTTDELRQTELVFFITPRLVKPMPAGVKTELPVHKPSVLKEEQEFQWIPFLKGDS